MDTADSSRESLVEWGYRDADQALRGERARLIERHRRELATLSPVLLATHARRRARIVAGKVAVLVALALPIGGIAWMFGVEAPLTWWLVGGLLLALGAHAVGLRLARATLRRRVDDELRAGHDAFVDVERLRAPTAALVARLTSADGRASVLWPMLGAALLGPILVHLAVYLLAAWPMAFHVRVADFDKWVLASLVLVIPAHVALVICVHRFAGQLVRGERAMSGWAAFGWCCLGGVVPGLILYAIPTAIVALTALVLVPALFGLARTRFLAENRLLFTYE